MKTTETTITQLAQEVLNNMELKTRDNGAEFYCLKNHDDYKWHVDLCREAHPDGIMPNDWVYATIYDSLQAIVEMDKENVEDILGDAIDNGYLEPDCYTSDLLNWVSDNLVFHSFCDDAIDEYGAKDFIGIVSMGQHLFKRHVFESVAQSLAQHKEKQ